MRYVVAQLPETLSYVDIWAVSDIHRGHRLFDIQSWRAILQKMKDDEHAYMVLNGDLVEAALKSSRYGDTYRSLSPKEEKKTLIKELEPIKHKILAITSGNHEERHRDSQGDPAEEIADKLGILDKHDPGSVLLEVQFGLRNRSKKAGDGIRQNSYTAYITHGEGGGRRPGAKINRMQELAWIIDGVDAYIMGHVHDAITRVEYRHRPNRYNKTISIIPVAYVIAGSLIRYGDYAERKMYAPNANTFPVLRLGAISGANKSISVIVNASIT